VYSADHGMQPIYDQMANSALHLWLAFNPDGSSRVDFFQAEPNPPYPDGDHSADITGRHAVWDFDSDLPEDLARFLSDTLKAVYTPDLTQPDAVTKKDNGAVACCPTIISTLDGRVPIVGNGFAERNLSTRVRQRSREFYEGSVAVSGDGASRRGVLAAA